MHFSQIGIFVLLIIFYDGIVEAGVAVFAPNSHHQNQHKLLNGLESNKHRGHYYGGGGEGDSGSGHSWVDDLFSYPDNQYNNYGQGGNSSGSSQWEGGQSSSQGTYGTEGQQEPPPPPNVPTKIYIVYYAPRGNRRLAHFGVVIQFKDIYRRSEYHFGDAGAHFRYYENNGELVDIGRTTNLTATEVYRIYYNMKEEWGQSDYNKYHKNCFTFVKTFIHELTGKSYKKKHWLPNIKAWVEQLKETLKAIKKEEKEEERAKRRGRGRG